MRHTVLIVDDDPIVRRLLEHHLSAEYDVITATDGAAGREALEHAQPHLLITDADLPGPDGLALCRLARQQGATTRPTYVIVITAHDDPDRHVAALDAGADDYLTKPFARRELLACVRAGDRIIDLEQRLADRSLELWRFRSRLEETNARLAQANERLRQTASTDELTGLPNRRAALIALTGAWKRSRTDDAPVACVLVDVDHFKRINDTLGHSAGDRVLAATATTLRKATRTREAVFRLGGEEFLVICPGSTAAMAADAAERLRRAVAAMDLGPGAADLRVTVSLGVAERAPDQTGFEDLLKAADDAMYDAKSAGRDCVRIAPTAPHAHPRRGSGEDGRRRSA